MIDALSVTTNNIPVVPAVACCCCCCCALDHCCGYTRLHGGQNKISELFYLRSIRACFFSFLVQPFGEEAELWVSFVRKRINVAFQGFGVRSFFTQHFLGEICSWSWGTINHIRHHRSNTTLALQFTSGTSGVWYGVWGCGAFAVLAEILRVYSNQCSLH